VITVLAGGVGAAKFLQGLVKAVPEEKITIIVNTGDDIQLHGLHISPDLDIVTYTLAGMVDKEKGWGIDRDTFHCLEMLKGYEQETWFNLGDKDFATHVYRTCLLKRGLSLSEVTNKICQALGLRLTIIPMTNEKFETRIVTNEGTLHFQEYLVKRQAKDNVINVLFEGLEEAKPAPGVIDSILNASLIVVSPSNPIVSIGTILSVGNVRDALRKTKAKVVAITPIIGGAPVKGPADKLMKGLGLEISAYSVARLYQDFLDVFILDYTDQNEKKKIEQLGLQVIEINTLMKTQRDKVRLAKAVLKLMR